MRTAELLHRISHLVNVAAKFIGVASLAVMMFLITADVFMRTSVNKPIMGTFELIQFLMVILIFFALPCTAFKDAHVSVDLVYDRFSRKWRAVIDSISGLLSLGLFVLICWQSIVQGIFLFRAKQVSLALGIPTYFFLFVVAIGCTMLCLVLLSKLFQPFSRGNKQ